MYRMLGRLFSPYLQEVIGVWIKLHNEELHGLYFSSTSIRMSILKRLRFVGLVAHVWMIAITSMIGWYNRKKYHLEELGVTETSFFVNRGKFRDCVSNYHYTWQALLHGYKYNERLGGSQSWVGRDGQENNLCPCVALHSDSPVVSLVARTDWAGPFAIVSELS